MILLTGGSGVLGQELQKLMSIGKPIRDIIFEAPARENFDILREPLHLLYQDIIKNEFSLIVHTAAYTDVVKAEIEKELCYKTNVIGTRNLASLGIPMLYISTEYVFDGEKGNYDEKDYPNPQNFYALTKLLGEFESRRTHSVVIRVLFKSRPFKHPYACDDQFTSGDYVDKIAPEIVWAIRNFNSLPDTIHIGFKKKSTFDLAKESRPDIVLCKLDDIETVKLPRDTSLNCKKWEEIKNGV